MPNPGSMIGAFTDELGELGKNIIREAVAVPKDVVGKAMESLGVSSGKKPQQSRRAGSSSAGQDQKSGEKGPLDPMKAAKDQQAKQAVARAALAQLAGGGQKQKEPGVWERQVQEAEQKKELAKQQQKQASTQQLAAVSSKRKRGDLYGMKAKKNTTEVGRNVRQD
ncbi:MAG: hypothetical protein Q8L37_04910 [Candidatus Gottesmanbacteria bacterium]|nr:hypothetical protein [Candidatus Gottesmanbacteria bacterium]